MKKLVYGVGINDRKYTTTVDGKTRKEYALWVNMLERCYSENHHKKRPTYLGCTVSDSFKDYTYFFEWCQTQIGFGIFGYSLDKDLIYKGNREYSEDNCVFIPNELNMLLTKRQLDRGTFPIGVSKDGKNYRAQCSYNGIRKNIGTFTTPELAFNAYKTFKEAHIKELAEKYKTTIDQRAYLALMNYEVDIND
jgi:hypothetical protein